MKSRFITQILYLAVLFSPVAAHAQAVDLGERMHVSVSAAPEYAYRYLNGATDMKGFIKLRNTNEKPLLGYTYGVDLGYRMNDKFGLEIGVYNCIKGFRYPHVTLIKDPLLQEEIPAKGRHVYNYIELPIKGIYYIKNGSKSLAIKAGIAAGRAYKNTFYTIYSEDGKTKKITFKNPLPDNLYSFSAYLGFCITFKLKRKFRIFAEPNACANLNKQYNAPIKQYLWCLGANLGLAYAFQ